MAFRLLFLNSHCLSKLIEGKNTVLIPIFWSYSQFGPYILGIINLVFVIFNLQSIWFLPLTH